MRVSHGNPGYRLSRSGAYQENKLAAFPSLGGGEADSGHSNEQIEAMSVKIKAIMYENGHDAVPN